MPTLNQKGAYYGHGVAWWTSNRLYYDCNLINLKL